MKNNFKTFVTILTTSEIHKIHIAKSLLANQNIHSFIFDENITNTIGTAFIEGYKLKVNALDFENANRALFDLKSDNN